MKTAITTPAAWLKRKRGTATSSASTKAHFPIRSLAFNRKGRTVHPSLLIPAGFSGPTPLGAFLDASLDLFVYAAIPFGFGLAHEQDALAAAFLLMGLMIALAPGLAGRAFAPLSNRSFAVIGHGEIFIAFAAMCVSPRWMFSLLAYFFGLLCVISGVARVVSTMMSLRAHAKP